MTCVNSRFGSDIIQESQIQKLEISLSVNKRIAETVEYKRGFFLYKKSRFALVSLICYFKYRISCLITKPTSYF